MIEIRSATFVTGATAVSSLPNDTYPEVAFAGRSNVGKSSLLNMLVGRKSLARTSGTPGKTREINLYLVNDSFYLADLPGVGYAKVSRSQRNRWASLISAYVTQRAGLRLLFHLIDSRHPPMAADLELAELYRGSDVPTVVLLTKADKLSGNERAIVAGNVAKVLQSVGLELPIVLTSSEKGRGREDVLRWIEDLVLV